MPDLRFFEQGAPLSLSEIAALCGARLDGDGSRRIDTAAPLGHAGSSAISFYSDRRRSRELQTTAAGAVFVTESGAPEAPATCAKLIVRAPQAAWAKIAAALHPARAHDASQGAIHPTARLEPDVEVSPGVVIGPGAAVGSGTVIGPGAVIGPGVQVGRGCRIGANATAAFALIGDRVTLAAGARIGEAGFGVAGDERGAVDVPQLGRVILQDGVSVGANSCVDRGAWDDTVIGENSKLDNLVHVAHNVRMGRNCRLAAYTGISGSVVIGDGVIFGGKAGVADQLSIGEGAAIGASASVFKSVPARETWTGFPARPMRQWLREQATLAKLSRGKKGTGRDEKD